MKYILSSYLEKYVFITTWKFQVQMSNSWSSRPQALDLSPFLFLPRSCVQSSKGPPPCTRGHPSLLVQAPVTSRHKLLSLRPRGVYTADGLTWEGARISPGSWARNSGAPGGAYRAEQALSGLWLVQMGPSNTKDQGREHLLAWKKGNTIGIFWIIKVKTSILHAETSWGPRKEGCGQSAQVGLNLWGKSGEELIGILDF